MSDGFRTYEKDFVNSTRLVANSMRSLEKANGNADDVISASAQIEGELSETEGYLRAMDVEFRTMASSDKRSAQEKLNGYKDEYRQMIESYQSAKFNAEALALKGGPSDRTRLIIANQKLDQSTATLEKSRQIVAQTLEIGNTVMDDMESQKETLRGAQDKVKETKQFTTDAKGVLTTMGRRALVHKICIYSIIILLLGAIVVLILVNVGLFKKNNDDNKN